MGIDFKKWWNESEIFCGEGGMEAAEQAWDYKDDILAKVKDKMYEARRECADLKSKLEQAKNDLESQKREQHHYETFFYNNQK
jgi:hypothetical protein